MMRMDRDPGRRELAVFAAVLPLTFALLGFIVGHRFGFTAARNGLWVAGVVLTAAYFAVPRLRRPLYIGMSAAVYPIGWLLSHVILLSVFLLVVTPMAVLLRMLGRDPLERRFDPAVPTYWVPHHSPSDVRQYFKQF
jgi:hypothetical protein